MLMTGAEELIWDQAMTVRVACQQITGPDLNRVIDSVDKACRLPTRPEWERKAVAHAEIFRLLADVTGATATAGQHGRRIELICDLMRTVGPAANGMIVSSRRRLIRRLRAGDADGAAREVENHLRTLCYMWRLASLPRAAGARGDRTGSTGFLETGIGRVLSVSLDGGGDDDPGNHQQQRPDLAEDGRGTAA
jgi:hypothetical protein